MLNRCHACIVETIYVATAGFFLAGTATACGIIPCFHGDAHHLITLMVQHECRNGTINTATHRYQHFSFTAHVE